MPRPRAWMLLLAGAAALVPVASLERGAISASAAPAARPAPAPARAPVAIVHEEQVGQEPVWHDSLALGTPNAGRLVNGVALPVQGIGYYTYNPLTQTPPNLPGRRTGTAMLVRQVLSVAAWWAETHPGAPRLGVGDLSRTNGGPFDNHVSHQNGLDVDIRLPRRDGAEGPASPETYDRGLTQALVDRLVSQGAQYVFYGPHLTVSGPPEVEVWPNHDDHLHVRFPDPDGLGD